MQAKNIMTKGVVTINPETTIKESVNKLIEHEISGFPVVDENKNIVGVVTEKDLIVAYDFLRNTQEPVKDFMSTEIISIDEEMPIEKISRLLVSKNIRRVPVLKDKKVLGIVSRRDVLKCILD